MAITSSGGGPGKGGIRKPPKFPMRRAFKLAQRAQNLKTQAQSAVGAKQARLQGRAQRLSTRSLMMRRSAVGL